MARGWESKSVESQIEDAENTSSSSDTRTIAERESDNRKRSLSLSRKRLSSQLEATTSAAHKQALEHAIAHLDGEIAKLE